MSPACFGNYVDAWKTAQEWMVRCWQTESTGCTGKTTSVMCNQWTSFEKYFTRVVELAAIVVAPVAIAVILIFLVFSKPKQTADFGNYADNPVKPAVFRRCGDRRVAAFQAVRRLVLTGDPLWKIGDQVTCGCLSFEDRVTNAGGSCNGESQTR